MKLTNPLLVNAAQQVMQRVPQQLQGALNNAVMAGNKIMYSDKTRHLMMSQMKQNNGDVPTNIGEGIAKLVSILYADSKGKLPLRVLIPAGVVLVCQAIEFVNDAGGTDITPDVLSKATMEFSSSFLQLLGVTPDKLQQILANGAQGGAQPQAQQPAPNGGASGNPQ